MERRRLGRLGHESSVLIYGAAALSEVSQDVADTSVQQALDAGINHVDVAASYGDAEDRLGPWTSTFGPDVFLATKTGEREREAAWAEINRSLERLRVDRVDLIQLHAVGDLGELDRAVGPGGALEAAVRARDEGMVGGIGITGHGHHAPATHHEALRRFPFDTVITPWNPVLARDETYAAAFTSLVAACQVDDVGLMTIKTLARRNWPEGVDAGYATWYEPWDEQAAVDAAVSFCLAQPGVTGLPTAGDVRLLPLMVEAERRRRESADAAEAAAAVDQLLADPSYASPFIFMPW